MPTLLHASTILSVGSSNNKNNTFCAWATLVCYSSMCVISFILGQKHYPITYNYLKIGLYLGLALLLYFATTQFSIENFYTKHLIHTLIIFAFLGTIYAIERPKKVVI